jgi:hypothetical protein
MKLQQKFGSEFEKFHFEVAKPYFENSTFFLLDKPNELGKQVLTEVNARILFIEKHLDDLLSNTYLIELSQLLIHLDTSWLVIPTETFDKIKSALLQRKDEIDSDLIAKISSAYQRISIN